MVKLTITPHRGNGARTFPSTGFLGMTPVTLAGVVRVKIEEDLKTIEASSLVIRVRCYESLGNGRDGGASSTSTSSTERRSSASAASSGYHSSSCLGGNASHSSSYSFSDIFKSGAPSSSSSSHTNSTASSSKGRVLYEKSVQMWSPPTTSMKKNQDASTSTASSPLSSRSSSQDTTSSLPPPPQQQHAYPPRSREASTCSSTSNDTDSYATLGDFTKAWRIVIPVNAVEQGAKSTMIFKNWRIWWAVEAGMCCLLLSLCLSSRPFLIFCVPSFRVLPFASIDTVIDPSSRSFLFVECSHFTSSFWYSR